MKPLYKSVEERDLEADKSKGTESLDKMQTCNKRFLYFSYSDSALRSKLSSELMACVWNQATRCALRIESALPTAACPGNQPVRVN